METAEEDDDEIILSEKRIAKNRNRTLELVGRGNYRRWPTKIQEAIRMAHDLMDQVVRAKAAKDADNKIKWEDDQEGNHCQRQTRDMKLLEYTRLELVTKHDMVELYHSATGLTFIISSVPVPLNVVTAGRAITQCYSTPINNRLRTLSNTKNPAVIQDGRVDIQSKNVGYVGNNNQNVGRTKRNQPTNAYNGKTNVQSYNCNGKGHYARNVQNPEFVMQNNAYGDNTLKELNAIMIMMERIQLTDDKSDAEATYGTEFISEAKMVSKVDVKTDKSKSVTSCSTPKNEQAGSSSVRIPESKDKNLKKRVLMHTKSKSASKDVKKSHSSVSLVLISMNSNLLKAKTVNDVHDGSNLVIHIVLWIIDSGCSKHMTGKLKLLRNFIEKFMSTVCFGNDHFARITGYEDYVQGNLMICYVYYVDGLGHNLFLGEDLLTGSQESNRNTISISKMAASSLVCLMSKATSIKSWLWHFRLSHLNFGTINHLTKQDLVDGLLRFKYDKDHLCSACEQRKSKKAIFPSKTRSYETRTLEVLDNSAANTLDTEDTPSSSSIIVEDHEAPQIVSSLKEPIANEPSTPVSDNNFEEPVQEDIAELDENTCINPFGAYAFKEAESSSNYQDLSNMHEFYQQHRSLTNG
uniref:Uncharacterized protein n=1 Tax=Tanacetum cinerariifolium TaxID=118510 RepID=A0A6L2KSH1_TANCI|nr:hypothetical protein [Tanacetum cinerariifolium]